MGRARTLYGKPKRIAKLYPYSFVNQAIVFKWVGIKLTRNPQTVLKYTSLKVTKAFEMKMEMELIAFKTRDITEKRNKAN